VLSHDVNMIAAIATAAKISFFIFFKVYV